MIAYRLLSSQDMLKAGEAGGGTVSNLLSMFVRLDCRTGTKRDGKKFKKIIRSKKERKLWGTIIT